MEFVARDFRDALGAFATGITIVTTVDAEGRRYGMTANSFAAVSLDPPLVLWSVGRNSPSATAFIGSTGFGVSILGAGQLALSRHFARSSSDKFAGVPIVEGLDGIPLIAGAIASFECRTEHRYPGGDHLILVGRVHRYQHREGQPLLFCRGRYQQAVEIGAAVGGSLGLEARWGGLA